MPKGTGYLRKRGKSWHFEYMRNGIRYYANFGPVSKSVARELANEFVSKIIREEILPGKEKVKFGDLVEHYREWYETHSKAKKRSKEVHLYRLSLLGDFFGDVFVDRITWSVVERYKRERLDEGVSKTTINKELKLMKTVIRKAMESGIYKGEMPKIELFKEKETERVRSLTPEEAQKLIEACPEWFRPVIIFALNTGLRAGEIFSLRWENVDFEKGVIRIEKETTKTKDVYTIPMNSTVRGLLEEVRREQEEKGITHGFVFTNKLGLPYKYEDKTYGKIFRRACAKAGIKDFRFHDLRHTFASWVAMSSRDIYAVQKLLNHKDLRMTKRYAHLTDGYLKGVVESLEGFGIFSTKK